MADKYEWMQRAKCRDADPETFFPSKGCPAAPAMRICGACPVRAECLDHALAYDERFGIWGGVGERERKRIRGRRRYHDAA